MASGPRPGRRATRPFSPKDAIGCPLRRSSAIEVLAAYHVQTALGAIAPVGDAARAVAAQSLRRLVGKRLLDPDRFSCRGVERLDQADAVGAVQDAVDHQRRGAEVGRVGKIRHARGDAWIDGGALPGDAEPGEVAPVDLIERRVFRAARIAPVAGPFALAGALLGAADGGRAQDPEDDTRSARRPHGSPP